MRYLYKYTVEEEKNKVSPTIESCQYGMFVPSMRGDITFLVRY